MCARRDGPGTPGELDKKTGLDMALRVDGTDPACQGPVPGSAIVDVVEVACGSETGPAFWWGGVRPPAAREPAAVRGDPRLRVRGRPAGRGGRPVRLRAVGAGLAGPRLAGREGGAVLPAREAGPPKRAAEERGPRPGYRAAPAGPVGLRDIRPARRRGGAAGQQRGRVDASRREL